MAVDDESEAQTSASATLEGLEETARRRQRGAPDVNGGEDGPSTSRRLELHRLVDLGFQQSLGEGLRVLAHELDMLSLNLPSTSSGLVRMEVVIPNDVSVIAWLQEQTASEQTAAYPVLYFSPRRSSVQGNARHERPLDSWDAATEQETGCIGAVCQWKGQPGAPFTRGTYERIQRYLASGIENVRVFGGMRFNPLQKPAPEWEDFGSFLFCLPAVELQRHASHSVLSCTVAWDDTEAAMREDGALSQRASFDKVHGIVSALNASQMKARTRVTLDAARVSEVPSREDWQYQVHTALSSMAEVEDGLNQSQTPSQTDQADLRKVVLARRSKAECGNPIEPLQMLSSLQDRDRNGYQFCLMLDGGSAFFGSTPERLYARHGSSVASEAVAATRRSSSDGELTRDLLSSEKDHNEFIVVRNAVQEDLQRVCGAVRVDVKKEVLKHVAVQHLYGRLSGELLDGRGDYDLLSTLHPTPAVAGYPSRDAMDMLNAMETFDRGFYSGPFGYLSSKGSEFAVAIRSALAHKKRGRKDNLMMYAGVGVVVGSSAELEWKELDLKVQQFTEIVSHGRGSLRGLPNINAVVASVVVEELCRMGVKYFCIAPGSRSTPLVLAAANHPRAELVTCIDERSLGFFGLGIGKATGTPAAIITTSGTAVANLLPAVVEAHESNVPMLLLTADRPSEMQFSGSNQTIDQDHIFGRQVRWFRSFPAFSEGVPLRMLLSGVSAAWRSMYDGAPGPVHLNFEFREPLAPTKQAWDASVVDSKVKAWEDGVDPFCLNLATRAGISGGLADVAGLLELFSSCKKGMVVVGTCSAQGQHLAILRMAKMLGWPVIADASSGMKVGMPKRWSSVDIIHHLDHILLNEDLGQALQPDWIIQVGRDAVSKRITKFVSDSALNAGTNLVMLGSDVRQRDPSHTATHHLTIEPNELNAAMDVWLAKHSKATVSNVQPYRDLLKALDTVVSHSMGASFIKSLSLTEPHIARIVAQRLPRSHALYLGNSMPIRDIEMFSAAHVAESGGYSGVPVGSSRGASGIDGVISASAAFAEGLGCPTTLLIGDVSFLHDTNGLNFLRGASSSSRSSPLTVVVINNGGGRIFEMLPLAEAVETSLLENYFVTDPQTSIASLCQAFGVPYRCIKTLEGMRATLEGAWDSSTHNVVEIVVDPLDSKLFRKQVKEKVQADVNIFLEHNHGVALGVPGSGVKAMYVERLTCEEISYPLTKDLTTDGSTKCRKVMKLVMEVSDDQGDVRATGMAEVSPLPDLHHESHGEAKTQLLCVVHALCGKRIPTSVASLNGALELWLGENGIDSTALYPSVQFGLESAIIDAMSALSEKLALQFSDCYAATAGWSSPICGLISTQDSVERALNEVHHLVSRGFGGIKIKVARNASWKTDVQIVRAIRKTFGSGLAIRCDANRGWDLESATMFAEGVEDCNVEYIEEPVSAFSDLEAFCRRSKIPVALDENLDELVRGTSVAAFNAKTSQLIGRYKGMVSAFVIKPAVIGSVEKVKALIDTCCEHRIIPVISAAFESSIGMTKLVELASYANSVYCSGDQEGILHGLGTIDWNANEPFEMRLRSSERNAEGGSRQVILTSRAHSDFPYIADQAGCRASLIYDSANAHKEAGCLVRVHDMDGGFMTLSRYDSGFSHRQATGGPALVFVHGFLGSPTDWTAQMAALAPESRCYAVSLPGHAPSVPPVHAWDDDDDAHARDAGSGMMDRACAMLIDGLSSQADLGKPILVGYSMGARVALQAALDHPDAFSGLVMISGAAGGLEGEGARKERRAGDLALAAQMRRDGLRSFFDAWYEQPLFETFRSCPAFEAITEARLGTQDCGGLASALAGLGPGVQEPLASRLEELRVPVLILAGACDKKYVAVSKRTHQRASLSKHLDPGDARMRIVPNAGHAMHLECPHAIVVELRNFVQRCQRRGGMP